MHRYVTQATPNSEHSIMIFLPAVWRISVCGELGGVSGLGTGPDEAGEGTDSSVKQKYRHQCNYWYILYIKYASKSDIHALMNYQSKLQ